MLVFYFHCMLSSSLQSWSKFMLALCACFTIFLLNGLGGDGHTAYTFLNSVCQYLHIGYFNLTAAYNGFCLSHSILLAVCPYCLA